MAGSLEACCCRRRKRIGRSELGQGGLQSRQITQFWQINREQRERFPCLPENAVSKLASLASGDGAHKALPFAETAAETKLARVTVGAARRSFSMVPVLAVIVDVSVFAAGEKDVQGQRIRVGTHFQKRGVHVADYGRALTPACPFGTPYTPVDLE